MNDFDAIVALLGALVIALGLGSKGLSRSPVPPTLIALAVGIILGPEAANLINLEELWERSTLLERAARLTLGVSLIGVALQIPREFPRGNWRGVLTLVSLGMLLMWAVTSALVYLILGLPFWLSMLIGAVITPTDPIAASPIVTGGLAERNIPPRVRNSISFESGANDGLGYLFVFLPFLFLTRPQNKAPAEQRARQGAGTQAAVATRGVTWTGGEANCRRKVASACPTIWSML